MKLENWSFFRTAGADCRQTRRKIKTQRRQIWFFIFLRRKVDWNLTLKQEIQFFNNAKWFCLKPHCLRGWNGYVKSDLNGKVHPKQTQIVLTQKNSDLNQVAVRNNKNLKQRGLFVTFNCECNEAELTSKTITAVSSSDSFT